MGSGLPANPGGGQDTTIQSEVDVLNEGTESSDDNETVVSDETTDEEEPETPAKIEDEEEEETTEEPEEEEEIEEEEEEELDSSKEPTRPSWQTIKEKYPELAKDKDFRELYFRDKAFTDIYPTVADARESAVKAEQLDAIDSLLVDGQIEPIFGNLREDVLVKVADKILPALYKANQKAFSRAARPLIIDVMHTVMKKAEADNDENLKKSVRNISRALTGSPDLPTKPSAEVDPVIQEERNRLQQERESLFQTQSRNFVAAADRSIEKKLEQMVVDGLDPKKEFNEFTRDAIIRKTLADVRSRLASDEGLTNRVRQTHRLAAKSGFPDEYRARIISATLDRARKLIPVLRNKHRTAALGKQSTKGETTKKIVTKNETVTTGGSKATSSKSIDMRKTSAEDFLNDKVIFKK